MNGSSTPNVPQSEHRNPSHESDWRKFRELVPDLRERYIARQNAELTRVLCDSTKTPTERFWTADEFIKKQGRILRSCLDGHSRSRMFGYIMEMISVRMLEEEDIQQFSPELQEQVAHLFRTRPS